MYKTKVNVLCDINIILDVLLERKEFFDDSYKVISLINENSIIGFMSGISIDTIAYILKRNGKGKNEILFLLKELLKIFDIAMINKEIILSSLESNFTDLEDSIQYNSAIYSGCDYIITRNIKDFGNGKLLKIIEPKNFLSLKDI